MTGMTLTTEGLDNLIATFRDVRVNNPKFIATAINESIAAARTQAKGQLQREINFTNSYLGGPNDSSGKLRISRKAAANDLMGMITAQTRPTSLAQFSQASGKGLLVKVKPNAVGKDVKGLFFITLRNGNRGVAVRLKPGSSLRNSNRARKIADNLYLLYAPSVDQAFGVALQPGKNNTIVADAERRLVDRYLNQLRQAGLF